MQKFIHKLFRLFIIVSFDDEVCFARWLESAGLS